MAMMITMDTEYESDLDGRPKKKSNSQLGLYSLYIVGTPLNTETVNPLTCNVVFLVTNMD